MVVPEQRSPTAKHRLDNLAAIVRDLVTESAHDHVPRLKRNLDQWNRRRAFENEQRRRDPRPDRRPTPFRRAVDEPIMEWPNRSRMARTLKLSVVVTLLAYAGGVVAVLWRR